VKKGRVIHDKTATARRR